MGIGGVADRYPAVVLDAYRAQLRDAAAVQAFCEDYRAGATIDRELDEADRGTTIDCPALALWGSHGALPVFYEDVLSVWRPWAPAITGRGIEASHFLVEDAPDEVAAELIGVFAG
jgi:haloacetate dehalogenase